MQKSMLFFFFVNSDFKKNDKQIENKNYDRR